MPRRVTLPGADELFRSTGRGLTAVPPTTDPAEGPPATAADGEHPAAESAQGAARRPAAPGDPKPSRRQRHDEKITVYISATELVDLEKARLTLRAEHGLGVDRGRIVREALAVVLADLDAKGDQSILVRRLRSS